MTLTRDKCTEFYLLHCTSACSFSDLPAVVTLAPNSELTYDGVPLEKALRQLEELGADVVGINCFRGPDTMLPLIRKVRAECKVSYQQLCFETSY